MLAELSLLWEFKLNGKEYAQMISNEFVRAFTWKDTLNLWIQKKQNARKAQATAIGTNPKNFRNIYFCRHTVELLLREVHDQARNRLVKEFGVRWPGSKYAISPIPL